MVCFFVFFFFFFSYFKKLYLGITTRNTRKFLLNKIEINFSIYIFAILGSANEAKSGEKPDIPDQRLNSLYACFI
jgi:hypothetical protein